MDDQRRQIGRRIRQGAARWLTPFALAALVLLALPAAGRQSAQARLRINGHEIAARQAEDGQDLLAPLNAVCAALSAKFGQVPNDSRKIYVTLGSRKIEMKLGSRLVSTWPDIGSNRSVLSLLSERPALSGNVPWVPISCLALLGIEITHGADGAVTIQTEQADGPGAWKRAIGVPEDQPIRTGSLDIRPVKIATAGGGAITANSEIVVNVVLSRYPAKVQIYEVRKSGVEPILGQTEDGIDYYPLRRGDPAVAADLSRRLRVPLSAGAPGDYLFVVLATTQDTREDLRDVLIGRRDAGDWAIMGARLHVEAK